MTSMPATRDWLAQQNAKAMLERDLADQIQSRCVALGLLRYHTYDSRRSEPGYPDEHIVDPRSGRGIFRELKQEGKYPTPAQRKWLDALGKCNDVAVWRPSDLLSGRIDAELRNLRTVGGAR